MSICSLGGASIVYLRGTEPDPGPVTMTSVGKSHGRGPVVRQGQSTEHGVRVTQACGMAQGTEHRERVHDTIGGSRQGRGSGSGGSAGTGGAQGSVPAGPGH